MKQYLHALLLLLALTFVPATDSPQIIYLGSQIYEDQIYNTYRVDCTIPGQLRIDVRFYGGGTYTTTITCNTKVVTPGIVDVAYLITAAGERIGPLVPDGGPPRHIWLPLVVRT